MAAVPYVRAGSREPAPSAQSSKYKAAGAGHLRADHVGRERMPSAAQSAAHSVAGAENRNWSNLRPEHERPSIVVVSAPHNNPPLYPNIRGDQHAGMRYQPYNTPYPPVNRSVSNPANNPGKRRCLGAIVGLIFSIALIVFGAITGALALVGFGGFLLLVGGAACLIRACCRV